MIQFHTLELKDPISSTVIDFITVRFSTYNGHLEEIHQITDSGCNDLSGEEPYQTEKFLKILQRQIIINKKNWQEIKY